MIVSQNNSLVTHGEGDFDSIRTIEKAHIIISAIMLASALFWWPTYSVVFGLAGGCTLSFLNFKFIRSIVNKITTGGDKRNGARYVIKLLITMAIVGTFIVALKVSTAAFLVGFSSMVLGIFYEGFKSLFV